MSTVGGKPKKTKSKSAGKKGKKTTKRGGDCGSCAGGYIEGGAKKKTHRK